MDYNGAGPLRSDAIPSCLPLSEAMPAADYSPAPAIESPLVERLPPIGDAPNEDPLLHTSRLGAMAMATGYHVLSDYHNFYSWPSLGKLLLGTGAAAVLEELGNAAGDEGPALVKAAEAALEDFARDGCCYSFRAWHDDVNAIAAPFRDVRNGRWLVLSSSGPASSMGEAFFREVIGPKLRALAGRLG
jgi:hypothetical protein